jgi:hypothetical protein
MRKPASVATLETLGRVRLSRHFFLRDFLHSEIADFHGIPNFPDDPDLAVRAGERLAQELLDPLHETFGNVVIRSAYRAPAVNGFGAAHGLNCASNESNRAGHIWDQRDAQGRMGATACVVVPWFAGQFEAGRDWRDLAWWVHDHLPYSAMCFFPKLAAFNLTWREEPERTISSYVRPAGKLVAAGAEPGEPPAARQARYDDFPPFLGIALPAIPRRRAQAAE